MQYNYDIILNNVKKEVENINKKKPIADPNELMIKLLTDLNNLNNVIKPYVEWSKLTTIKQLEYKMNEPKVKIKKSIDYLLKNMPKNLHTDIKIKAAQEGTTIRNLMIESLKNYLEK